MRIVLDLSDDDLRYFRDRLRQAREAGRSHDEKEVLGGAARLVGELDGVEAPDFVRERLRRLSLLVQMLEDPEWRLTGSDRARVLDALSYFADPEDLIPDRIPGIGYLDDAIMIELVLVELRHEIEAYEKFCAFRTAGRPKPDDLESRRDALQTRMRRQRRQDLAARRSRKPGRSPISLW
jgi:uncharacterized membrane protein YkvA (DUF1232 family)